MTFSLSDPTGYLLVILIAVLVHEPWRWLGMYLGKSLLVESNIFMWVRLVAVSILAALVSRLIVMPVGNLAHIPLIVRLGAISVGIGAYYLAPKNNIFWGVVGGTTSLILLHQLQQLI